MAKRHVERFAKWFSAIYQIAPQFGNEHLVERKAWREVRKQEYLGLKSLDNLHDFKDHVLVEAADQG
jgi:hypothetical protein